MRYNWVYVVSWVHNSICAEIMTDKLSEFCFNWLCFTNLPGHLENVLNLESVLITLDDNDVTVQEHLGYYDSWYLITN